VDSKEIALVLTELKTILSRVKRLGSCGNMIDRPLELSVIYIHAKEVSCIDILYI
jgi:hypothetical protein